MGRQFHLDPGQERCIGAPAWTRQSARVRGWIAGAGGNVGPGRVTVTAVPAGAGAIEPGVQPDSSVNVALARENALARATLHLDGVPACTCGFPRVPARLCTLAPRHQGCALSL